MLAGDQPMAEARQVLRETIAAGGTGTWQSGPSGVQALLAGDRLDAVLFLGETHDGSARDRLAPFMAKDRLTLQDRDALLRGGDAADRGGEICACFGVPCADVETAIAQGAQSLDAVGEATRAGTNCGSCRPEIRALLRARRLRKAA
jgi:assimilatory nitrate reductase catalytic subunit